MPIGSDIRDARRGKRWTQGDLAARLAVSVRTISRWEAGASTPRFTVRERLAELLDIPTLRGVSRPRRRVTRPANFIDGVRSRIASALAAYSARRGV